MKNLLIWRKLLTKHHKYEFSILKGSHHLSKVFNPGSTGRKPTFYLPLFLHKAAFTLPLSDYIWGVLYDFNELDEEKFPGLFEFYPQAMALQTECIFYGEKVMMDVDYRKH
ncbi:hypothetical protein PVK06_012579 [Gossypium arboreum]|uniref:Uncharacterized protein n=1 Tax=Gossypium arboreum TaxID=29729 RepID=A0ABR0QCR0_GOSAR|nr:hypothetical protein PVK06_012579 [Gossypium arboreum]